MDKRILAYACGLGLIFGAATGTVLFALTNELWHIWAGAAIGLVVGSIAGASAPKKR